MTAEETMARVKDEGVIGIVRATSVEVARTQVRTLIDAGLGVVEISLVTPGAVDLIAEVNAARTGAVVGAGTVLDARSAESVIVAGAGIIVCPNLEPDVIDVAVRHDVPVVPGCLTPTEMTTAMKLGASAVKVFPAHLWTPDALAGMLQALPALPTIPTGGVSPAGVAEWIRAGATAVGVGGALTAASDPLPIVKALRKGVISARSGR